MDKRIAAISVALSAAILAGCAGLKAEDVKVYNSARLKQGEYEAVARLWVETWRTPFWVPSYSSPKDGIAALQDKAAALGANGLINVDCYGNKGLFSLARNPSSATGRRSGFLRPCLELGLCCFGSERFSKDWSRWRGANAPRRSRASRSTLAGSRRAMAE